MSSPETKTEIITDPKGRTKLVTYEVGTRIVKRSTVIAEPVELGWQREYPAVRPSGEAIEKMGLGPRQLRGLGVPPGTRPDELIEPEHPGDFLDREPSHGDPA